MKHIAVKNWEKFQHYTGRNPPWIKLYNHLLDDYEFACLQDASKLLALCTWLLASKHDNMIPYDEKWLKKKLPIEGKIDYSELISAGYVEIIENASTMLAGCKQNGVSETETETETETDDHNKPNYEKFAHQDNPSQPGTLTDDQVEELGVGLGWKRAGWDDMGKLTKLCPITTEEWDHFSKLTQDKAATPSFPFFMQCVTNARKPPPARAGPKKSKLDQAIESIEWD